jgi:hypothetical protein
MAFIQHCFIRKNTTEIKNKLKKLGYRHNPLDDDDREWIAVNYGMFISVDEGFQKLPLDDIDCGTNEDLFFALAALRNNSDYMQWFTDGEKWFQNKQNDIEVIRYGAGNPINFHKATVEEIIKHFNNM